MTLRAVFDGSIARPCKQASSASGILSTARHAEDERKKALTFRGLIRRAAAQSSVQER